MRPELPDVNLRPLGVPRARGGDGQAMQAPEVRLRAGDLGQMHLSGQVRGAFITRQMTSRVEV
jgi:hypothetical protein